MDREDKIRLAPKTCAICGGSREVGRDELSKAIKLPPFPSYECRMALRAMLVHPCPKCGVKLNEGEQLYPYTWPPRPSLSRDIKQFLVRIMGAWRDSFKQGIRRLSEGNRVGGSKSLETSKK